MYFILVMAMLNFQHHYSSLYCQSSSRSHSNMLIAQETFIIIIIIITNVENNVVLLNNFCGNHYTFFRIRTGFLIKWLVSVYMFLWECLPIHPFIFVRSSTDVG